MLRTATVMLALSCFGFAAEKSHAYTLSHVINGQLSGVEYTTQALSGRARFFGEFQGTVDGFPAFGYWSAEANHGPLPENTNGMTSMSGIWQLEVYVLKGFWFQRISFGGALNGSLRNRGDNNFPVDNFDLQATLSSSSGTFAIDGILRHDTFPPTVFLEMFTP